MARSTLARVNGGGETIGRVVSYAQRRIEIADPVERGDRAEQLVARDSASGGSILQ